MLKLCKGHCLAKHEKWYLSTIWNFSAEYVVLSTNMTQVQLLKYFSLDFDI